MYSDRDKIKFSVGYQFPDLCRFSDIVAEYVSDIAEVYFPFADVPNGRGISISGVHEQAIMLNELKEIQKNNIKLNLLWNGNCYSGKAISVELKSQVISSIEFLFEHVKLSGVTTASLFVAETVKTHFPGLEVRASVNMGIGSVSGMRYVKDYFDGFYLQRELNRYSSAIMPLLNWCDVNGKKLYLLANSGCLKNCSGHTFHDNLVAHEHEVLLKKNSWQGFRGICWNYYADPRNHDSFLHDSTWIRPEDLAAYKGLCDGIKLATRTHRNPAMVIESYVKGRFDGNILGLCEPDFSALCYLDNARFPERWQEKLESLSEIKQEQYCKEILNHVKL